MKTITGIYKEPGKPAQTRTIENDLTALQHLVGGYIKTVTVTSDCVFICNEEGKLNRMPANFTFCGEQFVGPVFICGTRGENFSDLKLSDAAEKRIKACIAAGDCFGM